MLNCATREFNSDKIDQIEIRTLIRTSALLLQSSVTNRFASDKPTTSLSVLLLRRSRVFSCTYMLCRQERCRSRVRLLNILFIHFYRNRQSLFEFHPRLQKLGIPNGSYIPGKLYMVWCKLHSISPPPRCYCFYEVCVTAVNVHIQQKYSDTNVDAQQTKTFPTSSVS